VFGYPKANRLADGVVGMEKDFALLILLFGGILVITNLMRGGLKRANIPSLAGFIVLGIIIRLVDSQAGFLTEEFSGIFDFLAEAGVILLLFRVGLESNLSGLRRQLKQASIIWLSNIVFSGILGYIVAYFVFELTLIQSLFIAIALTATSVAISVGVWHEARAIKSPTGQLLVDLAEMDDVSGIFLMTILFSVAPVLRGSAQGSLLPTISAVIGLSLVKFIGYGAACMAFSRFVEPHLTGFLKRLLPVPGQTVALAGFAFIIAALAGLIGFSVAIGAFFAGLIFSRDPQAVKLDTPFTILYDFIAPFFFINIGLLIDPSSLNAAAPMVLILLGIAIIGKVVGTGGPALLTSKWTTALLLGVSMVPRAEIAMVIMHRGLNLGEWAVPKEVFSSMVLMSLITAIIVPVSLHVMLKRWHPRKE
jgi:Kef-type K+ transport system membrane component KefB